MAARLVSVKPGYTLCEYSVVDGTLFLFSYSYDWARPCKIRSRRRLLYGILTTESGIFSGTSTKN
ncbi:hypothetical protein ARMSODRAFT_673727 [Armillaria solidipes]|uniref:Uncharacterized protein n=1 Tax=Armillaria solidipes TaxID=1076256 RepID=A0A2H3B201_9AGAR|nr:hypothetical protein ARMSODRAFT_673727 [Armillaria solidipes]